MIFRPLLVSIFLHFTLLLIGDYLIDHALLSTNSYTINSLAKQKQLENKKIKLSGFEIKKYPSRHVKNFLSHTTFSAPKVLPKQKPTEHPSSSTSGQNAQVSLAELGLTKQNNLAANTKVRRPTQYSENDKNEIFNKKLSTLFAEENRKFSQTLSRYPQLHDKSEFAFKFKFGDKKQDKYNPSEDKFYGFFQRAIQKFQSSLIRSYEQFERENPHLSFSNFQEQILSALIIYDDRGNIKTIRYRHTSNNEKLQFFFRRTLEFSTLDNPPKELLDENKEFFLDFTLNIRED